MADICKPVYTPTLFQSRGIITKKSKAHAYLQSIIKHDLSQTGQDLCQKWPKQKSITTCTSSYHKKTIYNISNLSEERGQRSCGDHIGTDGRTHGRTRVISKAPPPPPPMSGNNNKILTNERKDAQLIAIFLAPLYSPQLSFRGRFR